MTQEFNPEQKRWLEGFVSGAAAVQSARQGAPAASSPPSGPDAEAMRAQDRAAASGKLSDPEKWKRAEHPFDAYARFTRQARSGAYPKPDDNFRWRYHGLFYVAPAQDGYMCRMRIPNGVLSSWQFAGVADVAELYAGGYAHVTTRANLQIREIKAEVATDVLETLTDLGITSRGSGADNIRNVTGSATAGVDAQELLDTRPYARAWHHHILNDRSLYGLPRKFNVAFDGGGVVATLEDTNDIGFQAVAIGADGEAQPGVWWRLALGGITGHRDLARDTGVLVALDDASNVADAIIRVFIDHGDRRDRNKARLKYLLDAWGFDKFLVAVQERLGRPLTRVGDASIAPRPPQDRLAHLGVRAQKQAGLNWIGVWTPLGRMSAAGMRDLAEVARVFGDGDIRLTVWQNLLISGVPDAKVEDAVAAIKTAGFDVAVSNVRAGLIACTGNRGCKFAASDTKGHALQIADHLDARLALDQPINIHLTGCHNSCAQHYIGDIGLIGAKVELDGSDETIEGYNIFAGGGAGAQGAIGREIFNNVAASDAPRRVEALLRAYLARRASPDESFHAFSRRFEPDALRAFAQEIAP